MWIDYSRCELDCYVYVKLYEDSSHIIFIIYVDDRFATTKI